MQNLINSIDGLILKDIPKKEDPLYFSRQDYKFIIPVELIEGILNFLKEDFFCRHNSNNCIFHYYNYYFDTDDYKFFNLHKQGKYNRIKIRIRNYESETKSSYLECKRKAKGKCNQKERCKINVDMNQNDVLMNELVRKNIKHYNLKPSDLKKRTEIAYNRINLMGKAQKSRISLDYDIVVKNDEKSWSKIVPGYAVLEVKTNEYPKKIIKFLRRSYKIRETDFSKYCIALCVLEDNLKKNKWKQVLKKYF